MSLPTDRDARNALPIWDGLMMYFPDVWAEIAKVSVVGNKQHNLGQKLFWNRAVSTDHLNKVMRHCLDHGTGNVRDTDGTFHLAKAAWRVLAELQLAIESEQIEALRIEIAELSENSAMFDKLLDFLAGIWHELIPIVVLHPYNAGVQLRMGKLLRVLPPGGWYWRIPFLDEMLSEHVVPRTERLTGLATTTVDGKAIGFDAVITYRISDIQKALLDVYDLKDAIADSCAGIIGTELSNMAWMDIIHGNTVEALTAACRKRGWKWGVEIQQVQLTGVAPVKNLRVSLSGHERPPS